IAQRHRSHAVPAGQGAIRIPEDLRVIVGMQIDKPWCHNTAGGIQNTLGCLAFQAADLCDLAALDADIANITRCPRSINDRPAFDDDVIISHWCLPATWLNRDLKSGECMPLEKSMDRRG